MPTAMVVNPAKKRKRRRARTKTGRFKKTTRRRNPVAAANPRRRRRRSRRRTTYRRRRNPAGFNLQAFATQKLMPSAIGAVGALGLDMVMAQLPIPPNIKTGPMAPLVKGIGAVGMGMIANMVVPRRTAEQFVSGALTVVMYSSLKDFIQTNVPGIPLGNYPMYDAEYNALEYYSPSQLVSAAMDEPLGAYLDDDYDDDDDALAGAYDEPLGAYLDDDAYRMRNGQEDLYL